MMTMMIMVKCLSVCKSKSDYNSRDLVFFMFLRHFLYSKVSRNSKTTKTLESWKVEKGWNARKLKKFGRFNGFWSVSVNSILSQKVLSRQSHWPSRPKAGLGLVMMMMMTITNNQKFSLFSASTFPEASPHDRPKPLPTSRYWDQTTPFIANWKAGNSDGSPEWISIWEARPNDPKQCLSS